jgi:hypothetical protein
VEHRPYLPNHGRGAGRLAIGATCVGVVVPGVKLMLDRSLARESTSSACPEASAGQGVLLAAR